MNVPDTLGLEVLTPDGRGSIFISADSDMPYVKDSFPYWMQRAGQDGHTWVDQARANFANPDLSTRDERLGLYPSIAKALEYGFNWYRSPEGHDFWFVVYNDLCKSKE